MAALGNAFITITADNKAALNALNQTKGEVTSLGDSFRSLAKIVSGIAIFEGFRKGIKDIGDFQRQMTDLSFVTTDSKEQLKSMENAILDMSKATGQSREELANAAIAAGRFGVYSKGGEEGLLDFVDVLSKAVVLAPDFAGNMEEAGTKLATLNNVLKLPVESSGNLIAALDKTADATASTSGEISDVVLRYGALINSQGKSAKEMEDQATKTIALAAFLKDLGVNTEVAGSSMSQLALEIVNNKKEFTKFIEQTGGNAKEFSDTVGNDAVRSIQLFFEAMEKLNPEQRANQLAKLGLNNIRLSDSILKASQSTELLNEKIAIASNGFNDLEGFQEKFQQAMETLPQRVNQAVASFTVLFQRITVNVIPAIASLFEWLSKLGDNQQLATFLEGLVNTFLAIAQIVGSTVVKAFQIFQKVFSSAFSGIDFEALQAQFLSVFRNLSTIVLGVVTAFAQMSQVVYSVAVAIGAPIFGLFAGIIELIANNMQTLIPIIQAAVIAFLSFQALSVAQVALTGMITFFTALVPAITTAVTTISVAISAFQAMAAAGMGTTAVFGLMQVAWTAFSTAFLASPVGWILAGIAVTVGVLAAAFISASNEQRAFNEGTKAMNETLAIFNPNLNYTTASLQECTTAGYSFATSLASIRDMNNQVQEALNLGYYEEWARLTEEVGNVTEFTRGKLVDTAIAYGENAEEAQKWAESIDLSSGYAKEKIEEHFKAIADDEFPKLAQSYIQNYEQIVGTQKYSVDALETSMQAWRSSMVETMTQNGLTADQMEIRMAAMTANIRKKLLEGKDIGASFVFLLREGMTRSQALSEIAKAGGATSQAALIQMAAQARKANDIGKESALLYAAGVISQEQFAALKGAELSEANINSMLKTNSINQAKVAKSSAEVVRGAVNAMLGVQAKGGDAITENSRKIGANFSANIANGLSSKLGFVREAINKLLAPFNSVAEQLGIGRIFANLGGAVNAGIDSFVKSVDASTTGADQAIQAYADLGVEFEGVNDKVNQQFTGGGGGGGGKGGGGGAKKAEDLPAGEYAALMDEVNGRLEKAVARTKVSLSLNDENINKMSESGKSLQNELKQTAQDIADFDFSVQATDLSGFSESAALGFEELTGKIADNGTEISDTARKYANFIKETVTLNDEFEQMDENNITVKDLGRFVTQLAEQVALSSEAVRQLEGAFNTLYNRARDTIDSLKSKVQELQDQLRSDSDTIDYEIRLLTKQQDIEEATKALEDAKAKVQEDSQLDLLRAQQALADGQERLNDLRSTGNKASATDVALQEEKLSKAKEDLDVLRGKGATQLEILTAQKKIQDIEEKLAEMRGAGTKGSELEIRIQEENIKNLEKELQLAQGIAENVNNDSSVQRAQERLDTLNKERQQMELIQKITSGNAKIEAGRLVNPEDLATLQSMDQIMQLQVEKAIKQREAQEKIAQAQQRAAAFEQVVNAIKAGTVALEGDQIKRTKDGAAVTDGQLAGLQEKFDLFAKSADAQDAEYANQLRSLAATKLAFETEKAQLAELKTLQDAAQEAFRLYADEEKRIKEAQYKSDVEAIDELVKKHKNMSEEQKSNIDSVKKANEAAIQDVINKLNDQKLAADAATRAWLSAAAARDAYSAAPSGSGATGGFFAGGGFTGRGGKFEAAGVVHKGEYVIPQYMLNKLRPTGLIDMLERMRRGFATGGMVGEAPTLFDSLSGISSNSVVNNVTLDVKQVTNDRADMMGAYEELLWMFRQKLRS